MRKRNNRTQHEEGFMLIGVVVLVFLVLLALSIAAPKVARALRRDQEVESIHRANEYVRAIQLYYRKFGHYPGNMEQLEKSNNIRFLRQKYVDPMTGKPNWRLIHQGEAKTTVKGFFGQPLSGLPGGAGGLGSAASMVSPGQGGSATVNGSSPTSSGSGGTGGGTGPAGSSFSLGSSPFSSSSNNSGSPNSGPGSGLGSSTGANSGSSQLSSIGGAPIVGVGSSKTGDSISIVNEQTTYQTWEFLYDPRIEQLKAKAALLGGAASSSTNSFGLGTAPSASPGLNANPGSTTPSSSPGSAPTTPQ